LTAAETADASATVRADAGAACCKVFMARSSGACSIRAIVECCPSRRDRSPARKHACGRRPSLQAPSAAARLTPNDVHCPRPSHARPRQAPEPRRKPKGKGSPFNRGRKTLQRCRPRQDRSFDANRHRSRRSKPRSPGSNIPRRRPADSKPMQLNIFAITGRSPLPLRRSAPLGRSDSAGSGTMATQAKIRRTPPGAFDALTRGRRRRVPACRPVARIRIGVSP